MTKHWRKKSHSLTQSYSNPGGALEKLNHRPPRLTVCVTYGFHNMSKYRERMGRSLGVEICKKMEIKIDETYHVASCCFP